VRRRLVAVAAGVILIAAAILAFALESNPLKAGTNTIQPILPSVFLGRQAQHCQRVSRVPGNTNRVEVIVTRLVEGARRLRVEVTRKGSVVSSGTQPVVPVVNRIRLHPHTPAIHHAQICFSNPDKGRIAISGGPKRLPGRRGESGDRRNVASVIFLRHGSASWASQTGNIAERYANAQTGPLGGWSFWVAALMAITAAGLALWFLVFEPERRPS
jgi:hypothetical protein